MRAHHLNPFVPCTQETQPAPSLSAHTSHTSLSTHVAACLAARQHVTEITLLHLLAARWQFFTDMQHNACPHAYEFNDYDGHYIQSNKPFTKLNDVMAYWHLSNTRLEHTLEQLSQQGLEYHMIDLNALIERIISVFDDTTHLFEAEPYCENGSCAGSCTGEVDVGIATTLPIVIAPSQVLCWVFSELLITSWCNSLPTTPQTLAVAPVTTVATVAVSCLDADDAWHITISSDHHHARFTAASLEQFKRALHRFGGDIYTAYEDHASLQTVVLPKCPRV